MDAYSGGSCQMKLIEKITIEPWSLNNTEFVKGNPMVLYLYEDALRFEINAVYDYLDPKTGIRDKKVVYCKQTMDIAYIQEVRMEYLEDEKEFNYAISVVSTSDVVMYFKDKNKATELYNTLNKWRFQI